MNAPVKVTALTYATTQAHILGMEKGQTLIYHVGLLMNDRQAGPCFQTIHGVALAAWEAYEQGKVTLVQRKVDIGHYQYMAIRR